MTSKTIDKRLENLEALLSPPEKRHDRLVVILDPDPSLTQYEREEVTRKGPRLWVVWADDPEVTE